MKVVSGTPEELAQWYDVDPATGCWTWNRSKIDGYGQVSVGGKRWLPIGTPTSSLTESH